MDIAVFAESLGKLGLTELTAENIESLIKKMEAEYNVIKNSKSSKYEEAVNNAKTSKAYREGTGYTTYESLIPRLRLLQNIVSSGQWNTISEKYSSARKRVSEFMNDSNNFSNGKLKENSIDKFMNQINTENLSSEEMAMIMRVFAQECVRGSHVFGNNSLRASQTEMVSAFLRGENIALGMGGGKSVAYIADAIIHRMILGQNANIEILVGNDDPANFVDETSQARKILEFPLYFAKSVVYNEKKPRGANRRNSWPTTGAIPSGIIFLKRFSPSRPWTTATAFLTISAL